MIFRLGRITSRLSKDITTLDNQLPMQFNQLLTMMFSVIGTIALVFYTYPILGVIFVPIGILYYGPRSASPFLLWSTLC